MKFFSDQLFFPAQQAENKTGKESSLIEPQKVDQHTDGVVNSRAKIVEAYLNRKEWRNERPMTEHDFYLKAKKDLAKHHKQKVDEVRFFFIYFFLFFNFNLFEVI